MKKSGKFKRDLSLEFGGSLLVGKRHSSRPLSSKRPTHLVLKARNQMLLLRRRKLVEHLIAKFGWKFGLRLYKIGVHSDHVHTSLRTFSRKQYNAFVRAVTSELVRLIPGLQWALRPYTRIGDWGRGFGNVIRYIIRNILEADLILDAEAAVESIRRFVSRLSADSA